LEFLLATQLSNYGQFADVVKFLALRTKPSVKTDAYPSKFTDLLELIAYQRTQVSYSKFTLLVPPKNQLNNQQLLSTQHKKTHSNIITQNNTNWESLQCLVFPNNLPSIPSTQLSSIAANHGSNMATIIQNQIKIHNPHLLPSCQYTTISTILTHLHNIVLNPNDIIINTVDNVKVVPITPISTHKNYFCKQKLVLPDQNWLILPLPLVSQRATNSKKLCSSTVQPELMLELWKLSSILINEEF